MGQLLLFLEKPNSHPRGTADQLTVSPQGTSGLQILAGQALPKLWAEHFPREKQPADALERLFGKGVSWWEVFAASDIGAERSLIADRFVPREARVLDVGCGRGFFSLACARRTHHVTSLDLMDGGGRVGWWEEFKKTSSVMGLSGQISGVRASATSIPFGGERFDLVASVHSVRNFGSGDEIRSFFGEASKVLKEGGRLLVVESDVSLSGPAYRTFYSMRIKLGWELRLPSVSELVRWLGEGDFSEVSHESLDTGLRYAPVYLPFDTASMKDMKSEYDAAKKLLLEGGERHPPILIVTAVR